MRPLYGILFALGFCFLVAMNTGCQSHIGGQTLPSGYYLDDDIRYYSPGARNPLQNEATKLQN